jgi:hypothetical protein
MNTLYIKIEIIIFLFIVTGCIDLERDNPLDGNNINAVQGPNIIFSYLEVNEDDNSDGVINKGETIGLRIYLKNIGNEDAYNVNATISTTSSFITSLYPAYTIDFSDDYYYSSIGSGYESNYGGYPDNNTISFNVSENTPSGTVLTFNLNIEDNSGNHWTDSFDVLVQNISAQIEFSRFEINEDNNNDGFVNKGETIGLRVYLKNTGTSAANNIDALITCSNSYVSSLNPSYAITFSDNYYDDKISPGNESYYGGYPNTNTLTFHVSDQTPTNTILTFILNIEDEFGNIWTDSFDITVKATGANIEFSRYEVSDDNNNNGTINSGESISLRIYLENTGTSSAVNVDATLSCSSGYITSLSPTYAINFSDNYYDDIISPGNESYYGGYPNSNSITFNVSASTPYGSSIVFSLSIVDESENSWSDSFTITVY